MVTNTNLSLRDSMAIFHSPLAIEELVAEMMRVLTLNGAVDNGAA
jgi:hypothetical protein